MERCENGRLGLGREVLDDVGSADGGEDAPKAVEASLTKARFAGRDNPHSAGRATTLSQKGIVHKWRWADDLSEQTMYVLGAASSYAFSGKRLEKVLRSGFELEQKALLQMANGEAHAPLSQHTSAGGVDALEPFLAALQQHVPWTDADWFVNLQVEGTSAVLAAIDICIQQAAEDDGVATAGLSAAPRTKVAVGARSYHGPPSTAFGSATPLGKSYGTKAEQLTYPVPMRQDQRLDETEDDFHERMLRSFTSFLDAHAHEIAVMLFEPQWGSAACAAVWPRKLLKAYISLAQSRRIRVVCDEIMCGLGRHGAGSLFVSKAWDLQPDAVTFGKAIAGGVFPLSGVLVRRGAKEFGAVPGRKVMQSHTYSGASARALMAAEATLNMLPEVFGDIAKRGEQCRKAFTDQIQTESAGSLRVNGQGLLWGAEWTDVIDSKQRAVANLALQDACRREGVWPYFVPSGFIITPVLDVDETDLSEALARLVRAISAAASKAGLRSTRAAMPMGIPGAAVSVAVNIAAAPVNKLCKSCSLPSISGSFELKSSPSACVCDLVASASKDSLVFVEPGPPAQYLGSFEPEPSDGYSSDHTTTTTGPVKGCGPCTAVDKAPADVPYKAPEDVQPEHAPIFFCETTQQQSEC